MKSLVKVLTGAFLAVIVGFTGLSIAATYYGWNPATGLETSHGTQVDGSLDVPVIAQTGQTISGQKGGANAGEWIATGATTGAGTLTFLNAAPNGRYCTFTDKTTNADTLAQTTATTGVTVVTVAGTIVSGDHIAYQCEAY